MKSVQNVSFPHPVVGNGDDAAGNLEPRLVRSNDRETLVLKFDRLQTNNPILEELVQTNRAAYFIRVECPFTAYRSAHTTSGPEFELEIPIRDLYKVVDVEVGAIVLEPIDDYRPSDPHPDYGEESFVLKAGDVAAIGREWRIRIEMEWDPLRAPIQSIMKIVSDDREDGPMEAVLDRDKIHVRVCAPDYRAYALRKGDSTAILHSCIVLPVLVHAISNLDGEYEDRRWNARLRELLKLKELDPSNPLVAAQELIADPVSRGLRRLQELLLDKDDENE